MKQIRDLFNLEPKPALAGPVECLGMIFPNDDERRKHFLEKLREKLKDPEFRKIGGFPIGSDEDILALSDPPYYTACPNPFIADFIKHYGRPYDPSEPYSREPFAADVSEGKNDPIYNAHSYHTKVPHKAIMRYILHYTEPGDVVLDGFCGTGMTGVAAQLCGDRAVIDSLGYRVDRDGNISQQETDENGKTFWKPFSRLGARRTILNDLSPGVTFIAHRFNISKPPNSQQRVACLLDEVESECGWMYRTRHTGWESGDRRVRCSQADNPNKDQERGDGRLNFVLWSDVFMCGNCAAEVVLWHAGANAEAAALCDQFKCPRCQSMISKSSMERIWVTEYDIDLGQTVQRAKSVPVLINYTYLGKTYEKVPEADDLELIEKTRQVEIPYSYPLTKLHKGDKTGDPLSVGITHAHQFHSRRNLKVLAKTWHMAQQVGSAAEFLFTSTLPWTTKQNRLLVSNYFKKSGGVIGQTLSGTLYIS